MALVFGPAASPCLSFHRSSVPCRASPFLCRRWVVCTARLAQPVNAARAKPPTQQQIQHEEPEKKQPESPDDSQFVDVGVIVSKHGVRGELLIKSSTDFPQERFEKPGLRWLKVTRRGKTTMEQVELVKGRIRVGKLPCWLLTFKDVDTPEKASDYIGAVMVAKRDERPPLEEGEFYVPDLIGMDVVVQSTGETVGTVADMNDFGAHALLRVQRIPTSSAGDGPLMWIPFVEAIVPEVDMEQRRVVIAPPNGLLELNLPLKKKDGRSEERKEELRAKRKLQLRKSGMKKSLVKTQQEHLLAGLSTGESDDQEALLHELLAIDFKAVQSGFDKALKRKGECRLGGFSKLPERHSAGKDWLSTGKVDEDNVQVIKWWKQGLELMVDSEVAVASFITSGDVQGTDVKSRLQSQAERLSAAEKSANLEFPDDTCQIPWFICTESSSLEEVQSLLEEQEYFGLNQTQVCVLAQDCNPCFDVKSQKILRASPWKVAKSPSGDGGVLKVLIAEGLVEEFGDKGVKYIQIMDGDNVKNTRIGDPVLFGFAHAHKSDMSIHLVSQTQPCSSVIGFTAQARRSEEDEEETEMKGFELVCTTGADESLSNAGSPSGSCILSVGFIEGLVEKEYQFEPRVEVKRVSYYREGGDKGEVVVPEDPNAYELKYWLLDCITKCQPRKVSLLEVE